MLVIRFLRVGKKNQPSFKIVVTDKRRPPRAGRFVEEVGFYNPLTKEKVLNQERIKYWMSVGAKPSDTVYNLLVSEKIVEGKKVSVHSVGKKEKEGEIKETVKAPPAAKAGEAQKEPEKKEESPEKPPDGDSAEKPAEEVPAQEQPAPESKENSAKEKEEKKPEKTPEGALTES